MKLLKELDVKNKKVLLRCDLNISLNDSGNISDDFRIRVSLPTIKYLLEQEAKIIIMSHLGRPNGKEALYSLKNVAIRLSELLNMEVQFATDCIGDVALGKVSNLKNGQIVLLENLRYHAEEEANDEKFAKELASLGEIYVDDAFGEVHRAYASMVGIPKFLPSCAGFLLEKELEALTKVRDNCEKPCCVIIGGAKISTKIRFIQEFLKRADDVILGGALANTVLHAKGIAIGKSYIEPEMVEEAKKLVLTDTRLHLPVDAVVSKDKRGWTSDVHNSSIGKTDSEEMILDIGSDTEGLFTSIISNAKTIIWNGPLGLFELEIFAHGTFTIAHAIAESKAYSIIGGGETITFLDSLGLLSKFSHISSGGGAMLEFLTGEKLPGVEALN